MRDKVIDFPAKPKRKPLPVKDVDKVKFFTVDDRNLFITSKESIKKIMMFIIKEKITIHEDLGK